MESIAIDIVLLPEEAAMKKILAINGELRGLSGATTHPLDEHSCLPHVSLNMCGIRTEDLAIVRKRLAKILEGRTSMPVRATLQTKHLPDGRTISEFRVAALHDGAGDPLAELHRECLALTEDLELTDVSLDAYVQSDDLRDETVQWTTAFRANARKKGYDPHVTLNVGDIGRSEAFEFSCDRIALCQLGNYCTCRKILSEHALPAHGAPDA